MVSLARGQALPFEDGYFDFVLCHAVLIHIIQPEDRADLVAEISRVIKPGGIFVLSFPSVAGCRLIKFSSVRLN
ncbi:MAG: class I SAM-dependent methyltransferase [Candidatus Glassbacteria bacterium]|nr:class I SAM-dependent methyltransferase [Candidatus Glassbacteria bacterium]